jgi:hypothetical protein
LQSDILECKKGGKVHDDQKGNEEDWHDLQVQKLLLIKKQTLRTKREPGLQAGLFIF